MACPQGLFFLNKIRIFFWRARRGLFFLKMPGFCFGVPAGAFFVSQKARISFWRARRGLFSSKFTLVQIKSPRRGVHIAAGAFVSQKARILFWRARRGLFFLKKPGFGSPRGHPSKLMEGCSKSDLVCQK